MGKTFIADKETLDKCYNILSADGIFGFIEHCATLSPSQRIEYIGENKEYTPITVNKSTGVANYGSWGDFPLLLANKPWMVKSDGTPDYRLDETDYTKKEDGTASDIADTTYDGGAFSWLMKIYKQETKIGDDRIVKFSFSKREGFSAAGFIDDNNEELEGVWLPMFYGSVVSTKMRSSSGLQPCYSLTTAQEKDAIDAFSSRGKFYGGPIVNLVADLLIMFGKSTNSQEVFGYGNINGYDQALAPTYGVKQNAIVNGGQFYGTSDGHSLNKILHSIVLGTWQQWMRDPYTISVSGVLKVSKDYTYDLTGATYEDTGIDYTKVGDSSWHYPHKYRSIPDFGCVPDDTPPFNGSTTLGGCDGFTVNASITAVALRFGDCAYGACGGVRALDLTNGAGRAYWSVGAAVLLLPPAGVAA